MTETGVMEKKSITPCTPRFRGAFFMAYNMWIIFRKASKFLHNFFINAPFLLVKGGEMG